MNATQTMIPNFHRPNIPSFHHSFFFLPGVARLLNACIQAF
jgi:hypothetical protein